MTAFAVSFCLLGAPRPSLATESPSTPPTDTQIPLGNLADCLRRTYDVEYCGDLFLALQDIEAFWQARFAALAPGQKYIPLQGVVYYYPSVAPKDIDCNDEKTPWAYCTPAYYSDVQKQIVINEPLLSEYHARGDFSAVIILAHEWGHYMQRLLGRSPLDKATREQHFTIQDELQADCYAGLWAGYESRQLGRVEAGDLDEALQTSYSNGDAKATSWTSPSAHGLADQRVLAFRTGYNARAANNCTTWLQFAGEPVLDLGDYSLALSPGMTAYHLQEPGWIVLNGNSRERVLTPDRALVESALVDPDRLRLLLLGDNATAEVVQTPPEQPSSIGEGPPGTGSRAVALRYEGRQGGSVSHGVLYVYVPAAGRPVVLDVSASGIARNADWAPIDDQLRLLLLGLSLK